MAKTHRRIDGDDAFDANGLLKDGRSVRIPMMMADSDVGAYQADRPPTCAHQRSPAAQDPLARSARYHVRFSVIEAPRRTGQFSSKRCAIKACPAELG
jgi:hypothetical protein